MPKDGLQIEVIGLDKFRPDTVEIVFSRKPSASLRKRLLAGGSWCKRVGFSFVWKVPIGTFRKLFPDLPLPERKETGRRPGRAGGSRPGRAGGRAGKARK